MLIRTFVHSCIVERPNLVAFCSLTDLVEEKNGFGQHQHYRLIFFFQVRKRDTSDVTVKNFQFRILL